MSDHPKDTFERHENDVALSPRSRVAFEGRHGFGSGVAVAAAMELGGFLAHSAARVHRRARLLHRCAGGAGFLHPPRHLVAPFDILDPHFRRVVRHGRGVRRRHAVPVRHQLEQLHRQDRRRAVAAFGLRGPHRVFPGGVVSRRAAVRPPPGAHFFAGLMVAFGTLLSSFWILATNSWMQTPQGFKLVDGRFEPADWIGIIFNPSFPYRLLHTVIGFYITTAFVVMGVGAWLIRRQRGTDEARMMIRMALDLLIIIVPLQMFIGDLHGLNTLEYQPAKLAAIEGLYDTEQPAALTLFGIPDDAAATMHDEIEIPELGSLILTHSRDGKIRGLKEWPPDQRPPVALPFFAFRIMVGIAFIMLLVEGDAN